MNQKSLYAVLSEIGCKVFSFEDYPSNQGSWRVSFFWAGSLYEVSSNRFDGYISLVTTNGNRVPRRASVNLKTDKTDEVELGILLEWIRANPK